MRALLPAGKEPPPPLGGSAVSDHNSDISTKKPERLLASKISSLLQCCCGMLTNSYPVMVPSYFCICFWMKIWVHLLWFDFLPSRIQNNNCVICQVPVPICGLIALAWRVLSVDSSLPQSSYSFMTTLKQEFICSEIPNLQFQCLEILTAIVKALGRWVLIELSFICWLQFPSKFKLL